MWRWRLEFECKELTGRPEPGSPVDDDVRRLRRENAKLNEKSEI